MAKSNDNSQVVSILAYFLVGIIWYFADDKVQNAMTKHHVKQALNLGIISILISIIFNIFFWGMMFGGMMFMWWLMSLVQLALLVLWIFGLIFAINQEKKEIPIVGQFAEKYLSF